MLSFTRDINTTKTTLSKNKTTTKTNAGVEQGDGRGVGVRTILIENAELKKLLQNPKSSDP